MRSTFLGQNPLKRFKCSNSEAAFTRKDNLAMNHLKYDCGNKAPAFPCPMCDYQARRKLQLQKHINTSHKSKHGIHLQLEDTFILLNCYLYFCYFYFLYSSVPTTAYYVSFYVLQMWPCLQPSQQSGRSFGQM